MLEFLKIALGCGLTTDSRAASMLGTVTHRPFDSSRHPLPARKLNTLETRAGAARWRRDFRQPVWTVDDGEFKIQVALGHINHPGCWVMHCPRLQMSAVPLPNCKTVAQAQTEALRRAKEHVNLLSESLRRLQTAPPTLSPHLFE